MNRLHEQQKKIKQLERELKEKDEIIEELNRNVKFYLAFSKMYKELFDEIKGEFDKMLYKESSVFDVLSNVGRKGE